jgi:uncharacterized protein
MTPSLAAKEAVLRAGLKKLGGVLVAFSGGVDSSVLLAAAARTLPRNRILAVTARSPTYPADELKQARAIARGLGVRHLVIETAEFDDPRFVKNPPRRCYYCKSELFSELVRIARAEGLASVADATNFDDRGDYRPGRKAAAECGVRSPLLSARLTKREIRMLGRRYGLPNWDKPAAACLASRVPYGTSLEPRLLSRIAAAERMLKRMGLRQVRVRHHGEIARIEVGKSETAKLAQPAAARRAVAGLRRLGWRYVALDLGGYRTGSLNPPPSLRGRGPSRPGSGQDAPPTVR